MSGWHFNQKKYDNVPTTFRTKRRLNIDITDVIRVFFQNITRPTFSVYGNAQSVRIENFDRRRKRRVVCGDGGGVEGNNNDRTAAERYGGEDNKEKETQKQSSLNTRIPR